MRYKPERTNFQHSSARHARVEKGWVYIMSNPAMPGILKIGFSRHPPQQRATEMANTGVPHPYVIEYEMQVRMPFDIEQEVHRRLRSMRVGGGYIRGVGQEWFRCSVEAAINEIRKVAGERAFAQTRHTVGGRESEQENERPRQPVKEETRQQSGHQEPTEGPLPKIIADGSRRLREIPDANPKHGAESFLPLSFLVVAVIAGAMFLSEAKPPVRATVSPAETRVAGPVPGAQVPLQPESVLVDETEPVDTPDPFADPAAGQFLDSRGEDTVSSEESGMATARIPDSSPLPSAHLSQDASEQQGGFEPVRVKRGIAERSIDAQTDFSSNGDKVQRQGLDPFATLTTTATSPETELPSAQHSQPVPSEHAPSVRESSTNMSESERNPLHPQYRR